MYCQCLLLTFFLFFFLKKVKWRFYLLLLYYSRKPPLKLQINGISLFNHSRDPKIMDFFRRYYPYLVSNPLCLANLLQRQLTSFFSFFFPCICQFRTNVNWQDLLLFKLRSFNQNFSSILIQLGSNFFLCLFV